MEYFESSDIAIRRLKTDMRRRIQCRLLLPGVVLSLIAANVQAQNADVIRGRITSGTGIAIPRATVTATAASGGQRRQTRTDASGRYTIAFPNGDGDYIVAVTAIGFAPKHFELKRLSDEQILVGDVVMAAADPLLDPMRVIAPRQKVTRAEANAPDVGGTEQTVANAIVPGRDQGDLDAMMSTVAGVTPVPGADGDPAGFSVFGLSPDQNDAILNGLPFGGTSLPRDANVSLTVVTSPYDVSRGSFSGAQMSVRTRSGSNVITRSSSLNVDQPTLQWTGSGARQLGQPYQSASLGGVLSGPIAMDKAFYNVAYQADRRTTDLRTLLNASPQALQADGIVADSVARFLGVLSQLGIPTVSGGSSATQRRTDVGSFLANVDFTPVASTSAQSVGVVVGAKWSRDAAIAQLPTDVPARAGDDETWSTNAQLSHSAYLRGIVLSETTLGVAASGNTGSPFVRLPSGTVRINSLLDDGLLGLTSAGFGGSPSLPVNGSTLDLSFLNQSSWFSLDNKHRIKATAEVHQESETDDRRLNRLGSFDFNSLADLASGRPAGFVRLVGGGPQHSTETIAALSVGDAYKASSDIQIQYGIRLDANRYSDRPLRNADAFDALHIENDNVPNAVAVSPRMGFSWAYGGSAHVAASDGASMAPRAVVRGGAGVFADVPGPASVLGALQSSGANGVVRQIRCVGDAVPSPNWSSYMNDPSSIPTNCADGTNGEAFASTVPSLEYFSRDFRAPRSVRGNLQWTGLVLRDQLNATFEGTYSRNDHQRGVVDQNFAGIESFTLGSEARRPVYVDPSSIVPATGAIGVPGSRVSPLFSRVIEDVSDLRSNSRQFRVTLSPASFSTSATWNVSYVYAATSQQFGGFTSTASDPRSVAWARGDFDTRHAFTYNLAFNLFDAIRLTWSGRTASGLPFTPMIGGDVNGDGYVNDRAFVFNPDSTRDATMAAGLRALLQNGSRSVKRCLGRQLGTLAARNSCEAGWTSTASMGLSLNPIRFHLPQRVSVGVLIDNPLGAADLLLHGQNGLHGWGSYARPDQTLLFVQGFDPSTRQYRYAVNNKFGTTRQLGSFGRPITATLTVRLDIGPSRERQTLTQLLDRGRKSAEPRVTETLLKATFGNAGIVNPLAQMLRDGDRIHLDGAQADSLATMNLAFTGAMDSVWTDFASYAAAVPRDYDQGDVYARYKRARRASVDLLISIVPRVKRILTDEQQRRLSPAIASFLEPRYLAAIRAGSEGNSAGGPFANAAWARPNAGGTGRRTDVIITGP
jgi:hypothetical protein